jgi:hypothetical protein
MPIGTGLPSAKMDLFQLLIALKQSRLLVYFLQKDDQAFITHVGINPE